MINPGTYRAKAVSFQYGQAKTGLDQIAIDFVILDENHEIDGQKITGYFYFSDKATEHTMKVLRLCGWKGDDLLALPGIGTTEVDLACELNTYNGTAKTKVAFVNAPGETGGRGKEMPPDAKASFAERMRASVIESRKHEQGEKARFLERDTTMTTKTTKTTKPKQPESAFLGKLVIVRTRSAGVHAGKLVSQVGGTVVLVDSVRLFYWKVAQMTGLVSSCSELALYGIKKAESKLGARLPITQIAEAIEVIPVSRAAAETYA